MIDIEKLIQACKNDLQVARNKRDELGTQYRVQEAVIATLLDVLDRLEDADRKSRQPAQAK